jgi:membrane protease YdiL (CAAX protease family)
VNLVTQAFPLSDSDRAMFEQLGGDDLATALLGCVIAPVVEEMLFRGVILRGFLRRYGHAPTRSGAPPRCSGWRTSTSTSSSPRCSSAR